MSRTGSRCSCGSTPLSWSCRASWPRGRRLAAAPRRGSDRGRSVCGRLPSSSSSSKRVHPDLVSLHAYGSNLPQHGPPLRYPDPASRKLGVLPLRLGSHEETAEFLGRNPARAEPTERVEYERPFIGGSEHGAPEEAQGLLGGVAAVGLLPFGHGGDAPDRGDLGGGVGAVYEVVVEGVGRSLALARPQEGLVGVGEGGVEDVRWWVWFGPGDLVHHPSTVQIQESSGFV